MFILLFFCAFAASINPLQASVPCLRLKKTDIFDFLMLSVGIKVYEVCTYTKSQQKKHFCLMT